MRIAFIFITLYSLSITVLQAQKVVKTQELKKYKYPSLLDSVPMESSNYRFDEEGRLVYRKEYFFDDHPRGSLKEERYAKFDSSTMVLEEEIIHYKRNKEPTSERLKTKYWIYTADERRSKHVWRSYIDESGEIVKEDTLTYDQDSNLIKQCMYSYKGNTSLYCENWKYDRKGRLCKNTLYTHWTTINIRSKIVHKKERKKIYRYRYRRGKLKKARGKRYSSKYYEDWKYNKEGQIEYYKRRKFRKAKNTKKRKAQTGKKYTIFEEIWETKYKNGLPVMERHISKEKEQEKELMSYTENGLKKTYEQYEQGRLKLKAEFEYNSKGKLSVKITHHYNSKEELNYSIRSTYDDQEHLIKEEQLMHDAVIRSRLIEYNTNGDKISDSLYDQNEQKIEKTMYFYEYY
jgi:hypothetical protein